MSIHLKNSERGQVILLSLVIVIILTLAALFLLDFQLAIRSKMKVETAEQAAALAAAEWQRNSLNLIGELNLIKACDAMLQDYEPADIYVPEDQDRQTRLTSAACRTLTEMQSRIAFVGPMIAFGAAQQAAKYNGINIFDYNKEIETQYFNPDEDIEDLLNEKEEDANKKTVYDDIRQYRRKLDYDPRYINLGEYINHYKWKEPYKALLAEIRERGLAVRPSGMSYMTRVNPSWLKNEGVYEVCLNLEANGVENIQGVYLKNLGILYLPDSFWEGKWWQISYELNGFPRQSEIYLLNLDFSSSTATELDLKYLLERFLSEEVTENRGLGAFRWCVFNINQWEPEYMDEAWLDRSFLRDELKPGAVYQGAIAKATTYERIKTISKHRMDTARTEGQALRVLKRGTEDAAILKKIENESFRIGSDVRFDGEDGGSVAMPIGQLDDETPPYLSSMVLPVFHNTALIPSTMFPVTSFQSTLTNLERFLIWLGGLDNFDPPTIEGQNEAGEPVSLPTAPPVGTEHYYQALLWLTKPENRKSIFNPAFTWAQYSSMNIDEFFRDDYKYNSVSNPEGAGWLQQAYVGSLPYEWTRENLYRQVAENGEEVTPKTRETEIKPPFVLFYKDRGPRPPLTNEEYYLYTHTSGSSGYSRGPNIGPPRL